MPHIRTPYISQFEPADDESAMQLFMAEMRFQHNAGNAFSAVLFFYSIIENWAADVLEALVSTCWQMHQGDANAAVSAAICPLFQQFTALFPDFVVLR